MENAPGANTLASDAELIIRYRSSGNKEAVGELYKRYAHLVLGMCAYYFRDRDRAKDTVLQIFEKLFDELLKRDVQNFKAWLTFVTRNFCISELRKQQTQLARQKELEKSGALYAEQETEERLQKANENELQLDRLEDALKELKPDQKRCIELFYLQEKSYTDIVNETGYSLKEVKSHLQNGKRNLKIILTAKNEPQH